MPEPTLFVCKVTVVSMILWVIVILHVLDLGSV